MTPAGEGGAALGEELPGYLELDVRKIGGEGPRDAADVVAVEHYLTIQVNGMAVATLACTPENLDELVAGFLVGQGLVPLSGPAGDGAAGASGTPASETAASETVATGVPAFGCALSPGGRVAKVTLAPGAAVGGTEIAGRFVSSGCGAGLVPDQARVLMEVPRVTWQGRVEAKLLSELAALLQDAPLFRLTGGTHSALAAEIDPLSAVGGAPVYGSASILVRREDIGRHNAVDKVVGHLWLRGRLVVRREALVLVTSGRISSDIVLKAARAGFAVVLSRGAPTVMAVRIGAELGLTLVGFARGRRANVYSCAERVAGADPPVNGWTPRTRRG